MTNERPDQSLTHFWIAMFDLSGHHMGWTRGNHDFACGTFECNSGTVFLEEVSCPHCKDSQIFKDLVLAYELSDNPPTMRNFVTEYCKTNWSSYTQKKAR